MGTSEASRMWRQTSSPETFGKHEVEHDQVELVLVELLERRPAPSAAAVTQ